MSAKLEAFKQTEKELDEAKREVNTFKAAIRRLENDERVFIEGMLCTREVSDTFHAALRRECLDLENQVALLADQLEDKLK